MTTLRLRRSWIRLILAAILSAVGAVAQGASAFTYQGQLSLHGSPTNGTCSMQFRLFNQSTGGSLLDTIGPQDVAVSSGVFTALLDFGAEKLGSGERWLEVSTDCGTGLIQLSPRQPITATPYATFSNSVATHTITTNHIVDGAVGSSKLGDGSITSQKMATGAVTGSQLAAASVDSSKIADGTISAADIDSNSVPRRSFSAALRRPSASAS